MKRFFFSFCLIIFLNGLWAQTGGYQINIQVKPLKKTWVYLGYYYGKIMPVSDSAFLDDKGSGVFKGTKPLPQGIYIIAASKSRILTEMLVGKKQQFSIISDTTDPEKLTKFIGSPENDEFRAYTAFIATRARAVEEARQAQQTATTPAEKARLQAVMTKNVADMETYRKTVIKQQPASLLAVIFGAMQEPDLGTKYKLAKTNQDSVNAYYNARQHYWDGVNFMDGRIIRTPVFEKKMKTYFDGYVYPEADSIIHEANWMLALGRNDPEMFKYLINYFVDNYYNPRIMGQDKVFLNIYEKYFSTNQVNWLSEKQIKQISDRAYMLMANQIGIQAGELNLVDTNGVVKSLYSLPAPYTVVAFYDVNCGHCKVEIPRMDSLYKAQWKKEQVQVYSVMVAESSLADWKPFIRKYGDGWVHVHQTAEMKAVEEKNKQPNYHQLYDVRTTPTLFLLDKDKRIIAKNLSLDDLDKVLQQKIKQTTASK